LTGPAGFVEACHPLSTGRGQSRHRIAISMAARQSRIVAIAKARRMTG